MMVDPAVTSHHVSHEGKNYYFCSAGCRAKFAADPEPYLSEDSNRPAAAQPGAIWTCPMHPQIRQDHPGPCPICGDRKSVVSGKSVSVRVDLGGRRNIQ